MTEPHPVQRWLRFISPNPNDGAMREVDGELWVAHNGDWFNRPRFDLEAEKPPRIVELFHEYAVMQRSRQRDFRGVLPDQYAVEVKDSRGDTRIDYNGVPIKNADGSLNKLGKVLIEAHETQNRKESELGQEIAATKADMAEE